MQLEQDKGAAKLLWAPRVPRHPAISHMRDAYGRERRAVTWEPALHLTREGLGMEMAHMAPAERGFPPSPAPSRDCPPQQQPLPSSYTVTAPHYYNSRRPPSLADNACANRLPACPPPQGLLGFVVLGRYRALAGSTAGDSISRGPADSACAIRAAGRGGGGGGGDAGQRRFLSALAAAWH